MNFTLHNPVSCSCPACRVATTPAGAANIAHWNSYAAARIAALGDPLEGMAECAICGLPDDEATMEVYATRKICRCCQLDLEEQTEREFAQLIADSL